VPDPEAAAPLPGVPALLASLARRFAAVALVSGRQAAWLAERAGAAGVRYVGLYGAEELVDGRLVVDQAVAALRPAVRAAREDLAAAELLAAADLVVDGPEGLRDLLAGWAEPA
jgi:trehalose 6-phosphate phosphatase